MLALVSEEDPCEVFTEIEELGNILCLRDLSTLGVSQCGPQDIFAGHISAEADVKKFSYICVNAMHMQ